MTEAERNREWNKRMYDALGSAETCLLNMGEIGSIADALIEAATMPGNKALRTIVRSLGFRLRAMDELREYTLNIVNEGSAEPETVEGE